MDSEPKVYEKADYILLSNRSAAEAASAVAAVDIPGLRHRIRTSASALANDGFAPRHIAFAMIAEGISLSLAAQGAAATAARVNRMVGQASGNWMPHIIESEIFEAGR